MFDNISQGLFTMGATGYLVFVPVLRMVAVVCMAVSTYILLKARDDKHKLWWIVGVLFAPIFARVVFEVYRRWAAPKDSQAPKGSTPCLIISLLAFVLSAVLLVISIITIGLGYLKSEIDGEPLATYYDVHGNEYDDLYDVPLYDEAGNVYTHQPAWFTTGSYIDQNGKEYDGDFCYLSEDGYFYFDEGNTLTPYRDSYDYYTDGETVYYNLFNRVYWEEDGTIFGFTGRMHLELFDFKE